MGFKDTARRFLGIDAEVRQAYLDGYTNRGLEISQATAEGLDVDAGSLSYVRAAVRTLEMAFQLAQVNPAVSSIDGSFLASAIKSMAVNGETAYMIEAGDGGAALVPFKIEGVKGGDPLSCRYKAAGRSRWIDAADVLHFTWSRSPGAVQGVSPVDTRAAFYSPVFGNVDSMRLAVMIETALGYEAQTPVGRLFSVPEDTDENAIADNSRTIAELRGRAALLETTNTESQAGSPAARGDWEPRILRPMPDENLVALRQDLRGEVSAALGVPGGLIEVGKNEAATREDIRRLLVGTLRPLAARIADEIRVKMETDTEITFPALAADTQSKARALKALVDAGVDLGAAMTLAGFD